MSIARRALISRLSRIQDSDYVIDVSSIKLDGSGSIIVSRCESSKRGIELDNMPIVSNNGYSYGVAMELLGPKYTVYSKLYQERYDRVIHSSEESGSDSLPSYLDLITVKCY